MFVCYLQYRRPWIDFWVGKIPWRRDRPPTPIFLSFLGGSDNDESACNVGDPGSIPGLGRLPGGGHGNPHQNSRPENPMDRGAQRATVHGAIKSQTRPRDQAHKHTRGMNIRAVYYSLTPPVVTFGQGNAA